MRLGDGILLDIGSTTTDIVPLAGDLVCSLSEHVPFEGDWVRLTAEHFSTAADVHRLIGALPAEANQQPTANRASRSVPDSARRLARMIGRDLESASLVQWRDLAAYLADEQLARILRGCRRVRSRGQVPGGAPVVGAGSDRFLAARVANALGRSYRDFAELCTTDDQRVARQAADCAPAVAVAYLARMGPEEELR